MNLPKADSQAKDWKALLLSLFLIMGGAVIFLITLLLVGLGISSASDRTTGGPLPFLILSGGTLALGFMLLPGIFLNLGKFLNKPIIHFLFPRLKDQIFLPELMTSWLICLLLGQIIIGRQVLTFFLLPILNILAISLPIIFYLRISLRSLKLPSARRGWSLFGATLLVSPTLAFILEGLLIVVILLLFLVYSNIQPGSQDMLKMLFNKLMLSSQSQGEEIRFLANLLSSPVAASLLLIIFSLAIPLIEETIKIVLLLPLVHKIDSPVEGYVLGLLCGAAFAFVENIGFASSGSNDWVVNAMTRSTSALPHIFNSGMLGWALVSAWKDRKYWNLGKAFLAAILIHGSWNAIGLGFSLNSLTSYMANIPLILQYSFPWLAGWMILTIGLFYGMVLTNRQFHKLTE